jgi:hypothetical protein
MSPQRLSAAALADHLILESVQVRRVARALRGAVLRAAPTAAEAIKFRALCYFHADAWFGAIGGNICMIEVKRGSVLLSFVHGAGLPDPGGLLRGGGKAKRFVPVPDAELARSPAIRALVRAAAALQPPD